MKISCIALSIACLTGLNSQTTEFVKFHNQHKAAIAGLQCIVIQDSRVMLNERTDSNGIIKLPLGWLKKVSVSPVTLSTFHESSKFGFTLVLNKLPKKDTFHVEVPTVDIAHRSSSKSDYMREERYSYDDVLSEKDVSYRKGPVAPGKSEVKTTHSIAPGMPVSSMAEPGISELPNAVAGSLTATEINDFSSWLWWTRYKESELGEGIKTWKMYPHQRISVRVSNEMDSPLSGIPITLIRSDGAAVWRSKTDNTGTAELWNDFFISEQQKGHHTDLKVLIGDGPESQLLHNVKEVHQGLNRVTLPQACNQSNEVDIAIVLDATGSMGDELEYLKAELDHVIGKLDAQHPGLNFRTGAVVYRDFGDEYLTRHCDFGSVKKVQEFLKNQRAGGGGDFPEAVEEGLASALDQLSWNENARSKILLLVLDAPPHKDERTMLRMYQQIRRAASMGVRIIPLACSGIDKETEFFLRAMALATNGTYTALTDDSGIGNPHLKPSAAKMDVQKVNTLLIHIISRFVYMPTCKSPLPENPNVQDDSIDVTQLQELIKHLPGDTGLVRHSPNHSKGFNWKIYPNPTQGPFTIESLTEAGRISILDVNGKLIDSFTRTRPGKWAYDATQYPSGIYFVVLQNQERNVALKWIKV
jgi:hypothetical protein